LNLAVAFSHFTSANHHRLLARLEAVIRPQRIRWL
jgi:hypothetical protein